MWFTPRLPNGKRGLSLLAALFLVVGGCMHDKPSAPLRDASAVLADHDRELMALPGVVGVYVGLLGDDKTPCLKVMVKKKDPALERLLPRRIEGHPVIIEITGVIRPMR